MTTRILAAIALVVSSGIGRPIAAQGVVPPTPMRADSVRAWPLVASPAPYDTVRIGPNGIVFSRSGTIAAGTRAPRAINCPMPVARADSTRRDRMPVARPDTTMIERIPVASNSCVNPRDARRH